MSPAQRLSTAQGILSGQGPNFFYNAFLNAAQQQPAETPLFYRAIVKDNALITPTWLNANGDVASTMSMQMVNFAPRAATAWYSHSFADWIQPLKTTVYTGSVLNTYTDTLRERRFLGRKNYELTDHLGNVLAVVLDRKTDYGLLSGNYVGYSADLASVTDYYPGGFGMPGGSKEYSSYRMGNQGQEKDNEIYGDGNVSVFKYRFEDTRVEQVL